MKTDSDVYRSVAALSVGLCTYMHLGFRSPYSSSCPRSRRNYPLISFCMAITDSKISG